MTRSYDKQKRAVQIMDVNEKPEDYRNSDLILIRTPDGFIRMTKRPTVERVFQTVPKPLVSPANIYLRGAVPSQIMVAGTEVRNNYFHRFPTIRGLQTAPPPRQHHSFAHNELLQQGRSQQVHVAVPMSQPLAEGINEIVQAYQGWPWLRFNEDEAKAAMSHLARNDWASVGTFFNNVLSYFAYNGNISFFPDGSLKYGQLRVR